MGSRRRGKSCFTRPRRPPHQQFYCNLPIAWARMSAETPPRESPSHILQRFSQVECGRKNCFFFKILLFSFDATIQYQHSRNEIQYTAKYKSPPIRAILTLSNDSIIIPESLEPADYRDTTTMKGKTRCGTKFSCSSPYPL